MKDAGAGEKYAVDDLLAMDTGNGEGSVRVTIGWREYRSAGLIFAGTFLGAGALWLLAMGWLADRLVEGR
jgi:hypothetical protein